MEWSVTYFNEHDGVNYAYLSFYFVYQEASQFFTLLFFLVIHYLYFCIGMTYKEYEVLY